MKWPKERMQWRAKLAISSLCQRPKVSLHPAHSPCTPRTSPNTAQPLLNTHKHNKHLTRWTISNMIGQWQELRALTMAGCSCYSLLSAYCCFSMLIELSSVPCCGGVITHSDRYIIDSWKFDWLRKRHHPFCHPITPVFQVVCMEFEFVWCLACYSL